ncbi:MAG: hypothetical protein QF815_00955 [Candidatus Peribacteraceae bacterium]|jgi:hypothetical protein|nr:hypothetical protein [Candidatus Peribacteraceae bacterium]MDP7477214.1 hypothetical protein [Candidatus Peribacteraceae bacterium]
MTYLWFPIGLLLPTLSGWLALRLIEGASPVLYKWERWIAGFACGVVLTTYITFLAHIVGLINFTLLPMLAVQVLIAGVLGTFYWRKRSLLTANCQLPTANSPWKPWQKVLLALAVFWVAIKLIAGFIFLIGPPYFDDVTNNWNMRGKAFYTQHEFTVGLIPGEGQGTTSYPHAIPLIKSWLAHINGEWHEGLINVIHIAWYIAVISLVYFGLRRLLSQQWSALGAFILTSIPLFFIHGAAAYGDLFLSLHLFLAVSLLFHAVQSEGAQRLSFLRLGAFATALLVFTKNEALLLHLPPIAVLVIGSLFLARFSSREKRTALLSYIGWMSALLVPWLLFKWSYGLAFGNAKGVSGLSLEWHPEVLPVIWANTLFEGNWIFLPILFVGLIIARFRKVIGSSLSILVGFFFMVWLGQLPIYTLTPLYIEALMQTGYARGIIHLIPVVVMATTLLLHDVLKKK